MSQESHTEHHITPLATYLKIAAALFFLTFLTVGFHALREYMHPFSSLIAFTIAAIKAYLVMAWFMHLKYDTPLNRLIFSTGFLFLAVLVFFCSVDIYTRLSVDSVL
jgi:cytochrome c oxidase subunit IV